jgi:chemotaxis protein CheD
LKVACYFSAGFLFGGGGAKMIKKFSHHFQKHLYELYIGDYLATKEKDVVLSTVLGPCIAVCLSDKVSGVVGMNHFMLPGDSGRNDARYGLDSMNRLLGEMFNKGAHVRRMTAKVFGGARMLVTGNSVANANINFVNEYLQQRGITSDAADTGSCYARRIHFCSSTYAIHLKKFGQETCMEKVKDKYVIFK